MALSMLCGAVIGWVIVSFEYGDANRIKGDVEGVRMWLAYERFKLVVKGVLALAALTVMLIGGAL